MPYRDDSPTPLYITEGSPLTPQFVEGNRYAFEHMGFGDIPVNTFPSGFDTTDTTSQGIAQWKTIFPKELDSSLYFKRMDTMGNVCYFYNTFHGKSYFIAIDYDGASLYSTTMNRGCCFVSATGSIMPQLVVAERLTDAKIYSIGEEVSSEDATRKIFSYKIDPQACWKDYETNETLKEDRDNVNRTFDIYNGMEGSCIRCSPFDVMVDGLEYAYSSISFFKRALKCSQPRFTAFAITINIEKYEENEEKSSSVSFDFYEDDANIDEGRSGKRDSLRIVYNYKNDVSLSVNGQENSASGPLVFSEEGLQTSVRDNQGFSKKGNVIFCYPTLNKVVVTGDLVTDRTQVSKAVMCVKNAKANIQESLYPKLREFPAQHKAGVADCVYVNDSSLYFRMPNTMRVLMDSCETAFAVTPLRFCPVMEFSYVYRVNGKGDGINPIQAGGDSRTYDYFTLIVGGAITKYTGYDAKFYSRFIYYDSDTNTSVFCVDFSLYAKDKTGDIRHLQLEPLEILGMVHVAKVSGKLADIRAEDGNFSSGFRINVAGQALTRYMQSSSQAIGSDWTDYITSLNINHTDSGTSGTLTLDRHMMMPGLSKMLRQSIGAVTLFARNGYYDVNPSTYTSSIYNIDAGLVFRGYAVQENMSNANDSGDVSVSLVGIQKKLSDMKIVNCPYWDGDQVFEGGDDGVVNYLKAYTGCRLVYDSRLSAGTQSGEGVISGDASRFILPRSINLNSPAVHYPMGTPCLDIINDIARMVNHIFIVQPDGCGYFYGLNAYGVPTWIYNGPVRKVYREDEILTLSVEPYLENRYNTFMTVALMGKSNPQTGQIVPEGVKPGMVVSEKLRGDTSEYPWSKLITIRENGVLTREELVKFHMRNIRYGSMFVFLGNMTVPGYHDLFLLDKIGIQDDAGNTTLFYVTQISHSISLSSKEWTTSLAIATIQ